MSGEFDLQVHGKTDRGLRLDIISFANALLAKEDLDPVYNCLYDGQLERNQLRRWLFAYWCCYSAGASSWLSEQMDTMFWDCMQAMAANAQPSPIGTRWPRGRERRHFRGAIAVGAIEYMAKWYARPESAVIELEQSTRFEEVRGRVLCWPMFGPWIAFKVGDMLERCNSVKLDFTMSNVFFFSAPKNAAQLWCRSEGLPDKNAIQDACTFLSAQLSRHLAPPAGDRALGLQEYETILCKWGSHQNGRYPVGIDRLELRESLEDWAPVSKTAALLLSTL